MGFKDRAQNLLPFLKGQRRLPAEVVRSLHPTRNPAITWEREGDAGDRIVIYAPRPVTQGWMTALAKFVGEPPGKRIELSDEISALVWELCDGRHTVSDICREVGKKYKLGARQTEISVLQFLNMLRTRHLVGIPAREQKAATEQVKDEAAADKPLEAGSKTRDGDSRFQHRHSRTRRRH